MFPNPPTAPQRLPIFILAGATAFISVIAWKSVNKGHGQTQALKSRQDTLVPRSSDAETKPVPYPPDALPGARDIESPWGGIRVYEWGPETGSKVLLIHGISTPSIALAGVAHRLVERGYRVMLFGRWDRLYDFFFALISVLLISVILAALKLSIPSLRSIHCLTLPYVRPLHSWILFRSLHRCSSL
jgi:hypothetical protein